LQQQFRLSDAQVQAMIDEHNAEKSS
jgi:hypothetical protein